MSFTALTFDWANNNSVNYDIFINDFDNPDGWRTESAGNNINIISDSISRRAEQYIYGVNQNNIQQFNIILSSPNPKSRAEIDRIMSWLIQPVPQYLCVNQFDMVFYRYHGFFTNPQIISTSNMPLGLQFTFISTSPFAFTFPKAEKINITTPLNYTFNNESGDIHYLYPKLVIRPSNITQVFSIINNSDNGREFCFNFSAPFPNGSEVITVDNKHQIIQSSVGFSRQRFNQFNLNWLRLIRGANNLRITGNANLEIHYVFARRIGN